MSFLFASSNLPAYLQLYIYALPFFLQRKNCSCSFLMPSTLLPLTETAPQIVSSLSSNRSFFLLLTDSPYILEYTPSKQINPSLTPHPLITVTYFFLSLCNKTLPKIVHACCLNFFLFHSFWNTVIKFYPHHDKGTRSPTISTPSTPMILFPVLFCMNLSNIQQSRSLTS